VSALCSAIQLADEFALDPADSSALPTTDCATECTAERDSQCAALEPTFILSDPTPNDSAEQPTDKCTFHATVQQAFLSALFAAFCAAYEYPVGATDGHAISSTNYAALIPAQYVPFVPTHSSANLPAVAEAECATEHSTIGPAFSDAVNAADVATQLPTLGTAHFRAFDAAQRQTIYAAFGPTQWPTLGTTYVASFGAAKYATYGHPIVRPERATQWRT
jgi:hypothetical protein